VLSWPVTETTGMDLDPSFKKFAECVRSSIADWAALKAAGPSPVASSAESLRVSVAVPAKVQAKVQRILGFGLPAAQEAASPEVVCFFEQFGFDLRRIEWSDEQQSTIVDADGWSALIGKVKQEVPPDGMTTQLLWLLRPKLLAWEQIRESSSSPILMPMERLGTYILCDALWKFLVTEH